MRNKIHDTELLPLGSLPRPSGGRERREWVGEAIAEKRGWRGQKRSRDKECEMYDSGGGDERGWKLYKTAGKKNAEKSSGSRDKSYGR